MKQDRFYSLDVARGIAALSVVFYHWQHFFLPYNQLGKLLDIDKQPFYKYFFMFYLDGGYAVPLFFCISGFIFFWLYSDRIKLGRISFRNFAVLRMSRLYPLHLITLIAVAFLQWNYTRLSGNTLAYKENNAWHFLLNIFFIQSWGLEHGTSFNGPSWSASIEIMLYIMFFIFCKITKSPFIPLVIATIAGRLLQKHLPPASMGIECFFTGGIAYYIYKRINQLVRAAQISKLMLYITATLWIIAISSIKLKTRWINLSCGEFILFPATVLTLALNESALKSICKKIAIIGDISYSTYLIHFPIQISVVIFALKYNYPINYYSPYLIISFFAVLILISIVSHFFFERPAQRLIRSALIDNRKREIATVNMH